MRFDFSQCEESTNPGTCACSEHSLHRFECSLGFYCLKGTNNYSLPPFEVSGSQSLKFPRRSSCYNNDSMKQTRNSSENLHLAQHRHDRSKKSFLLRIRMLFCAYSLWTAMKFARSSSNSDDAGHFGLGGGAEEDDKGKSRLLSDLIDFITKRGIRAVPTVLICAAPQSSRTRISNNCNYCTKLTLAHHRSVLDPC